VAVVFLFGDYHDNPISHWLQKEVTADLYANNPDALVLGAEMFEADNQLLVNGYLSGLITEAKFEDEARLWNNYETDYKPLLKFAFDYKLSFVATNVPRRYANLVYRKGLTGLDSLSEDARKFIPPLPVKYDAGLPGYKKLLEMGHMGGGKTSQYFPMAQAIKDATMAYFILQNWSPGMQFLHFNGTGHSDNYEGIVWYLSEDQPDLRIITITTVMQEDPTELREESSGKADFTIVVPNNMTRTY
jgi:uncharacterized iron-regulated protein